jgi:uncharacterized membrane protein
MARRRSLQQQFLLALAGSSLVSVLLFACGAVRNHSLDFDYLVWNLFLAWLPLLFAVYLVRTLQTKLWSSWQGLTLSILWLAFLPNSFYMISDSIHLQTTARVDILYDTVLFTSFIYTGVILGFSSLFLIHLQLKKRLAARQAGLWIAATLLICCFGIYLGRDLRWNSWDIITNPGGLLFDVSDRLLHPAAYPQMLITVASFFTLLTTMYYLLWRGVQALRTADKV